MQMIFQMEAQKDFSAASKDAFIAEHLADSDQRQYFEAVADAFIGNKQSIDDAIEKASIKWRVARMARVDLAVLRLCAAEILFPQASGVPVSAAINEAVNIAKKYGSEDSGKFVNGILGKLAGGAE